MPAIGIPQEAGEAVVQATGPNTFVAASAVVAGSSAVSIPGGTFITKVSMRHPTGATSQRGEMYAVARLVRTKPGTPGVIQLVMTLWRGQVCDNASEINIPSVPNYYCGGTGYFVELLGWFGSGRTSSDSIACSVEVSENPIGDTFFYSESPTDRPGFLRSIALGDPAAGVAWTALTIPANVQWAHRTVAGTLVTSAVVNSRYLVVNYLDGSANTLARAAEGGSQAASLTRNHSLHKGGGYPYQNEFAAISTLNGALPDIRLPPTFQITFSTVNLDVGDNWGPGFALIEEWAGPL